MNALIAKLEAVEGALLGWFKNWFTAAKAKAISLTSAGLSSIADSVDAAEPAAKDGLEAFLKQSADDAVAAAETMPGAWYTKLEAAAAALITDAATKGVTFVVSEAHIIIESAYTEFKAKANAILAAPASEASIGTAPASTSTAS